MAVTLSSSTKQPAKPKISHWSFRLEAAIARVIAEGKVRTYDMGGNDSTLDVAKAIAEYRSEERRVGKECRSRRSPDHEKKKDENKEKEQTHDGSRAIKQSVEHEST